MLGTTASLQVLSQTLVHVSWPLDPALGCVHGREQLACSDQPPTKPGTSLALFRSDSYFPTPSVNLGQKTKASPQS